MELESARRAGLVAPPRETGSYARPPRVLWCGPKPAWLERPFAGDELAIDELDSLSAAAIARACGAFATSPDVLHVTAPAHGRLPALKVAAAAPCVLDLSAAGAMSASVVRAAALADLVLVGSAAKLGELRRSAPSLAARTVLFRAPVDLTGNAPQASLVRSRPDEFTAFRRSRRLAGPTLLFAGPFTRDGGLDLALDAAVAVRHGEPQLRFAAIRQGPIDGRYLERCRSRAATLGGHATIEESPAAGECPFWYAVADVVCLPCRVPVDGVPAKLAAAAARPFVGSDVGELVENVRNDETGYLTPVEDADTLAAAILALIGDDAERRRLGEAARRRAETDFSPLSAAKRLRRLWFHAVAKSF